MNGDRGMAAGDAAADGMPDTALDGAASGCSWAGELTFSAPRPLASINSSAYDAEPFVTSDRLTLYFASNRDTGQAWVFDSFTAERATPEDVFANASKQALSGSESVTQMSLSADGLTAVVASEWGGGSSDLWIATRPTRDVAFARSDFSPIPAAATSTVEFDPFISADGRRVYFERWTGSDHDIWLIERPDGGAFGEPRALEGINRVTSDEGNPSLTADERVIVFSSNSDGDTDLYFALRRSIAEPFSEPREIPDVNSESQDSHVYISPDGCELLFASNRPGGAGDMDIYSTSYVR